MEPNSPSPVPGSRLTRLLLACVLAAPCLAVGAMFWMVEIAQPYSHQILTPRQAATFDGTFFRILVGATLCTLVGTIAAMAAGAWRWKAAVVFSSAFLLWLTLMTGGVAVRHWLVYSNGHGDTSEQMDWQVVVHKVERVPAGKTIRHLVWFRHGTGAESYRMQVPANAVGNYAVGKSMRLPVRRGTRGYLWLAGSP